MRENVDEKLQRAGLKLEKVTYKRVSLQRHTTSTKAEICVNNKNRCLYTIAEAVRTRILADNNDPYLRFAVDTDSVDKPSDPPFDTSIRSLREKGIKRGQVTKTITTILTPKGVKEGSQYQRRLQRRVRREVRKISTKNSNI